MADFNNAPDPPLDKNTNAPKQQPPQRDRTAEEIAMIHAAMMEELGIGRKESLPLSDRGPDPVLMGAHLPVKRDMQSATAAWRNIQFNDVDPAEAELRSIADGQLYRLRRGVSTSSAGRGRGNTAPRGGYSFNGGRGGGFGRGGRGGRGGQGRDSPGRGGYMGQRSGIPAYDASSTPMASYSEAKRAMNTAARVESAITRLRRPLQPAGASFQQQQENRPDNNLQTKAGSRPSKPLKPLPMNSKFGASLASADAFFASAGFSLPRPAPIKPTQESPRTVVSSQQAFEPTPTRYPSQPSPPVAPPPQQSVVSTSSVASRESILRDDTPAEVRLPRAPSPPIEQNIGLSGSRWATPTDPVPPPTLISNNLASPYNPSPPLNVGPNTVAFSGRILLREQSVKIKKNSGTFKPGTVRLTKNDPTEVFFTLELIDAVANNFLVNEMVHDSAQFEVDRTVLTYRAAQQNEVKPPTWQINFQLPYQANLFANTVILSRKGPPAQYSIGISAPADARANSDSGPLPQSTYSASVDTVSYSAPEVNHHQSQPTSDELSGLGQVNQTFPGMISRVTQPLTQPSSTQYQEGLAFNDVPEPTSEPFSQVVEGENVEKLISFSDGEDELEQASQMNPDINELLEIDDSEFIQELFQGLEAGGRGSLLDRLSTNVIEKKGKPAQELTSKELLSSDAYWIAVTNAVGEILSKSETFNMLPEDFSTAYALDKSRKVLSLAVSQRGMALVSGATINKQEVTAERNMSMNVDTTQTGHNEDVSSSSVVFSVLQTTSDTQLDVESAASIKYSPNHLLGLRTNAVPVDIIDQPPRDRRATHTIFPLAANVSGWKSFADQQSEVYLRSESAEPSRVPKREIANQTPLASVQESSATASETVLMTSNTANNSSQDTVLDAQTPSPASPGPAQEPAALVQKSSGTGAVSNTPSTNVNTGPSKGQFTDMKLWESIFSTISPAKPTGSLLPGNMTKAETNQVPSRGIIRHHPSNSDINDRLAKSLEGFHLDKQTEVPVLELPTVAFEETVPPSSQENISVPSIPVSTAMPKVQTTPTLRQSHPVTSTPASQAMAAKISASLKLPFVASRVQYPIESTGTCEFAVGAQSRQSSSEIKTGTETKPLSIHSPQAGSKIVKPEHTETHDVVYPVPPGQAVTVPEASKVAQLPHSKPAIETLPEQKVQQEVEHIAIPATQTIEEPLAEISNVSMKGAPGLSASKWAKDSSTLEFMPRLHTPTTSMNTPAFRPYPTQGLGFWRHAPPPQMRPVIPMQSPLPTLPEFSPLYQTVLIQDPVTGALIEVTGMVKAGSRPLIAEAPVPQMPSQQMHQENHPYGMATSAQVSVTTPDFPIRDNMHGRHLSSGSSSLNKTFNPDTPSRNPPASSSTTSKRKPLSPTKVNLQARLQSRLNSSMTTPRGTFQCPH